MRSCNSGFTTFCMEGKITCRHEKGCLVLEENDARDATHAKTQNDIKKSSRGSDTDLVIHCQKKIPFCSKNGWCEKKFHTLQALSTLIVLTADRATKGNPGNEDIIHVLSLKQYIALK